MSEIADFYVTLRAIDAPILAAYAKVGESGELMAAKVAAANESIVAANRGTEASATRMATETSLANDKLISSNARLAASIGSASKEWETSYAAMAATTAELSAKMEMANAKAAASAEAMAVKIDAAAASTTATTAGKMAAIQKGSLLVSAAGLVASAAFVHMAGDFEQTTNKLVTSAGEAHAAIGQVRDGLLSMSSEVGVSAMHLSDALYKVESAGYHGAAGLGLLKAAEQGAKAEGADGVRVADALSSALRDYYPHASSAADITRLSADVMSKFIGATSAGKMTFDDLAGSLNSILPVASAAKISLSDTLGVLASMTVHGISAEQATQNMADAIRHLQSPTMVMSKAMATLGIDSVDLAAHLGERGLSGTMQLLSERVQHAMPPGTDKVILDLGNALSKSTPKVQELGQKVLEGTTTMAGFAKEAKGLDPISAKQAMSFATLAGSYHQLGTQQLSGAEVMQTYGGMMQKVMGDATGLKVALMTTGENAQYTSDAIKTISGSTADAAGNVKGWAEVQATFNQKLAEAKAGLGALAIQLGNVLLPIVTPVITAFADFAGWLGHHPVLAKALGIALVALTAGFIALSIAMWAASLTPISLIIAAIVIAVVLLIAGIVLLVTHWKQIWAAIVGALSSAWSAIVGFLQKIVDFVVGIPGMILNALGHLGDLLISLATKAWNGFTNGIKAGAQATLNFLKNLPREIGFALGFLAGLLVRLAIAGWNGFTEGIKTAFKKTVEFFKDLPGNIWDFLKNADQWIKEGGHKLLVGMWNGIVEGFKKTVQFFKDLPGNIWDFLKNADQWSHDGGHKLLVGLFNGIVDGAKAVWQWLKDLPGNILSFLGDVGSWLVEAGKNIVRGLWNGIKGMGSWLKDQVSHFASGIIDGFKSGFGIFSPSRLTHEMGGHLVTGLANGITDRAGHAVTAMRGLTSSVMAAATGLRMPPLGQIVGLDTSVHIAQGRPLSMPAGGIPGISEPGATGAGITRIGSPIPAGTGGQQVTNHYTIQVAGQVVTWKGLVTDIQQSLLRHNSRNVGNGTSGNVFVTT